MLTRRSARALRSFTPSTAPAAPLSITRPFSTSPPGQERQRAPALADVKPDGGPKFDARQREFREQLAANQRRREQEESASRLSASQAKSQKSASSSSSYSSAFSSDSVIDGIDQTLSSLSVAHAEEARSKEQASQDGAGKKSGPLTSLFYGTEAGRNMDKDIERSFSQVLARGKYVHSIVFHEVWPEKTDEYAELVGSWYPKMAGIPENKVNLVGSWRTEVGDCDTFGGFPFAYVFAKKEKKRQE